MTADPQPVPDAVLTAALGGYYGHPTAITAADPDVIDGLTAGLAAGLQRCSCDGDPIECSHEAARGQAEAMMSAAQSSAKAELDAKDAEIGRLTAAFEDERERARQAEEAEFTQENRAKRAEAELEQWRACFGETALKDARGVLAERDRLRAAVERVRKYADEIETWDYLDGIVGSSVAADIEAALDQAPAAEQDGGS